MRSLSRLIIVVAVFAAVTPAWAQQAPRSNPETGAASEVGPSTAEGGSAPVGYAAISAEAFERMTVLANAGDPVAAMVLARELVEPGRPMDDMVKAVAYLETAAAAGNLAAHTMLGVIYVTGVGPIAADETKAVTHLDLAAQAGDNGARRNFADLLLRRGEAGDADRAIVLLTDALMTGDLDAAIDLAEIYAIGNIVPGDGLKARDLYELAIVGDYTVALRGLGDLYRYGAPGLDMDPARAVSLYQQGSENGDVGAKQALAEMYFWGEGAAANVEAGVALLEELAATGQTGALVQLGDVFATGEVTEADGARAVEYYEQAVEAGEFSSLVRIADLYRTGAPGLAASVAEAVPYYAEAAGDGDTYAMRQLAEILIDGAEAVPADRARAADLLRSAADAGDAEAEVLLAKLLSEGERPAP
ncbi:MAG: hypothetical protein JWR75_1214 [Devosia sp.]|nr:hypothetical protein [Devosia sp.]